MGMRTEPGTRSEPSAKNLTVVDLVILAVGAFTLGVDGYVLSGLLPEVAADLRVSVGTAGQLTALFAIAYAVGSPIIATCTGSWDRRILLAGGMIVFTVGTVLQAAGPDFATVAAGRVIAALGAAAYQANAFSMAGLLSDHSRRARSLSIVAGGGSLALVAGLPFGILVGQAWGWRTIMWILVVPSLVSCLAVALLPAAYSPSLGLRERLLVLANRRVRGVLLGP
ncbi:MFS transporter [Nocardia sp. NBC_00511]|uniref:MFS transporter n=1 Tax=Nocardia sp. NBC_00511 TaxID=2903591 RepID=UPI0030E3BD81